MGLKFIVEREACSSITSPMKRSGIAFHRLAVVAGTLPSCRAARLGVEPAVAGLSAVHLLPKSGSRRSALAVLVALGLVVAAIVVTAIGTVPDIDSLLSARNGREPHHAAIRLSEISPYVVKALLAAEDREFYDHPGINPFAIIRAAIVDLRAREPLQGGSTITEQLAKNLLPPQGKDFVQKLREMQLALALEHRFTKAKILELYLNRVYFGSGAYGIDAAARRYFGKPPNGLTLYQSALLIGLLKAPSRLNPVHDPGAADLRARTVLQEMQEAGFISEGQILSSLVPNEPEIMRFHRC